MENTAQEDTASTVNEAPARVDTGAGGEAPPARVVWYRDWLLPVTVLTVLALDQASKYLVKSNLPLYDSWPDNDFIRITHSTNTGTAFSLFQDQTTLLIVASLFAIGFLIYFYRTQALSSRLPRVAIGLQLGGAFGNLIDRLREGAVVDFIDVGWWPIFNLADSCIVTGIAVLLVTMVFSGDATRKRPAQDVAEPDGPGTGQGDASGNQDSPV
jgi:signal peptidase II